MCWSWQQQQFLVAFVLVLLSGLLHHHIVCEILPFYSHYSFSYSFVRYDVRPFPQYALPPSSSSSSSSTCTKESGGGEVKMMMIRECEKRCNDEPKCRSFNFSPFYQSCQLLTTDVALQHIISTDQLNLSVGWIHKSLGLSKTKGCPPDVTMATCTGAELEKLSFGDRKIKWIYPSDSATDGSMYGLTHQVARMVELSPNGVEKSIVWSNSSMGIEVREITIESSLFKPDTDFKAYITPVYKYDQQPLQTPFAIPILANDPPGPTTFRVDYTSRLTAVSVSWDASVVSDPNVKSVEVFTEPNDGSCSTQPNGVCVVDAETGVAGSVVIEDLSLGGNYLVIMRIVDAYGTRSLDGTSSEFTPFYLMSHPTILSHSFTSDPTNPGTLHIELHIVGVPFFTIYFRDTDGGVQLAIESPQSDLATRTLVSEDATPGAVYDYIYIQNSLSGLAVRAPVVLTIDVDEVSIHPADLEDLNHYSDDTSAFSFYWTTVNSRDPAYQVYRRNTVNIILTPPTTSCGEERNPCSVPYMDGVLKIEGALDSVTYEAEIYVVNDRSSLTSPGINRKYLNKNLAITGQITSGFSVNCHTDNVTIALTVEDGVDFDSIEVWSFNEDDAVNGILVGEELERIPANGSLLAEVSVAGLIGSHLLLFYARLHSLDYEVYGTFQRIQIPVARTQVANEIIFCASTEDSSNAELDAANIIVKYRNEDGDTLCKSSIGSTTRGQRECFLLECDPPICAELDMENTLSISVHNDNSDLWEVKGVMELYLPPSIQYLMNVNGETLRGGNSPILNRRFDDFSDSQTRAAADNEDQLSTSIHSDKWWYIATTS